MKYSPVFLSLGANLGNPFEQLSRALTLLETDDHVAITTISSLYQTEPLYLPEQPDFLNLVCAIETDFTARQLLAHCQSVESRIGRQANPIRNAPRLIDIDIIFFADQIIHEDGLTVPHPRLQERQFVLRPLAEIAPQFICPQTHLSIAELLKACPDQSRITKTALIPIYYPIDGAT